jgi:hypothetical protein
MGDIIGWPLARRLRQRSGGRWRADGEALVLGALHILEFAFDFDFIGGWARSTIHPPPDDDGDGWIGMRVLSLPTAASPHIHISENSHGDSITNDGQHHHYSSKQRKGRTLPNPSSPVNPNQAY